MLALSEIMQYYSPKIQQFPRGILREYLQYLILQTIFSHTYASKLCFIWWTALRIGYDSQRFSEDLDFDNRGLTEQEFESITHEIETMLKLEWYEVEIQHLYKWAFHCHIKLPKLLFDNHLSSMQTEKLTIKIDTVSQGFHYQPQKKFIQKFGIFFPLLIASESVLLSMKLNAFFSRVKGRDLFDILYLLERTKSPHWGILQQSLDIDNVEVLKQRIKIRLSELDLLQLQKDVTPFLFDSHNTSVEFFWELIDNIDFE